MSKDKTKYNVDVSVYVYLCVFSKLYECFVGGNCNKNHLELCNTFFVIFCEQIGLARHGHTY